MFILKSDRTKRYRAISSWSSKEQDLIRFSGLLSSPEEIHSILRFYQIYS